MIVNRLLLILFLLWGTWWDIKNRAFPLQGLLAFAFVGIAAQLMVRSFSFWDLAGGAGVGAVIFGAALVYPECIGAGDGILVLVTGILLGFWGNLALVLYGLTLAMGYGIACMAVGRSWREVSLPLAPFLLAAGLGMVIL